MAETTKGHRYIVIYGKGGIGKTTVATNLAESLTGEFGQKVLLVGCSPKSSLNDIYGITDSSLPLMDLKRKEGVNAQNINKAVWKISERLTLTETGGPEPGVGCAGAGLIAAFEDLQKYKKETGIEEVDYTIYDLIGDIVCGGFSLPLKGSGREVLIVLNGELMALYAANNILRGVGNIGGIKVLGYVANMRNVHNEQQIVAAFSERTKVPVLAYVPRDIAGLRQAEQKNVPVVRSLPDSEIAEVFRRLAKQIYEQPVGANPSPIEKYDELFDMYMKFQESRIKVKEGSAAAYQKKIPSEVVKRKEPKRISIYGTGGIGKSTVSANVSASLVLMGERVFQIGCDPKHDSIANLCGELKPPVLDVVVKMGGVRGVRPEVLETLIFPGARHKDRLYGAECGGPLPGKGCGGRGVELALKLFEQHHMFSKRDYTFLLFDILGDTICGGFARPLKYTPYVYIVTNGEIASMTQAMKIAQSIEAAKTRGTNVGIAGIINNMRGVQNEQKIVEEVFGAVGLTVTHHIPRSELVQQAENLRTTIVEVFPDSEQAGHYMELARNIQDNTELHSLTREILSLREIRDIVNKYS